MAIKCWETAAVSQLLLLFVAAPSVGQERPTDRWLTDPVDDRTFATFLDFFTYDQDLPFDVGVLGDEEVEAIHTERIEFQSVPGVRVTALLSRSASSTGAAEAAVIFLHGGLAQGKDGPFYLLLGQLLARAGFIVLSIDMQHFGDRDTGLLETFSEAEKHERLYNAESTYLAWVVQTVKDVSRSYDFLVRERGADPNRVAVMGHSRGAPLAAIAGGADSRLAAVVMSYGGHFDLFEDGHLAAACPANYIGRIGPRPLLMINGENDADFLKETSVLPMQRLARDPKYFHWTPGGHGAYSEEDRAFLVEWLREHLR